MLSVQQIKFEILAYIKEFDPVFGHWTVGASSDPKAEMESRHGIDMIDDPWIFKQALTEIAARNICRYFHEILGCNAPEDPVDAAAGDRTRVYACLRRSG